MMFNQNPYLLLFTFLLPFQILNLVNAAQTEVIAHLRPIPSDGIFTLTFKGDETPFTSLSDLEANIVVSVGSTPVSVLVNALPSDLTIFQIAPIVTEYPYGSYVTIEFTDFRGDNTRTSYIKEAVALKVAPAKEITESDEQLINIFSKVDYVLEIVWIVASLINPYWLLYMDCKFFREMFDMFKKLNVQHEPLVTTFFKVTDRKVSGLRFPNIFGIFILKNDFASEWSIKPQNIISYGEVDEDRVEDLKVLSYYKEHEFTSFPLFLDNFGSELTFLATCILLGLTFEGLFKLLKSLNKNVQEDTLSMKTFFFAKYLVWNLLFLSILGSYQSLSYYTAIQIEAFFSTRTTHNIISFSVCIPVFLFSTIGVCIYVFWASSKRVKDQSQSNLYSLKFFGNPLNLYKSNNFLYALIILTIIPRSICFCILTVFVSMSPIAQTSVILFVCFGFLAGLIILRPFNRSMYLGFKIAHEVLACLLLTLLLLLAIEDNNNSYNISRREAVGITIIIFWILVPLITVIFAMIGLYQFYKQYHNSGERVPKTDKRKIVPASPVALENPQQNVSDFSQQPLQPQPQIIGEPSQQKQETPKVETKPENTSKFFPNRGNNKVVPQPKNEAEVEKITIPHNITNRSYVNETESLISKNPSPEIKIENKPENKPNPFGRMKRPLGNSIQDLPFERNLLLSPPNQFEPRSEQNLSMKKRSPFEPIELKLTQDSQRVIDEKGFKDFVASDHKY